MRCPRTLGEEALTVGWDARTDVQPAGPDAAQSLSDGSDALGASSSMRGLRD
jgi:hypothetical protein